jgi:hypothetical protein
VGKVFFKIYCLLIVLGFSQFLAAQHELNDTIPHRLKTDSEIITRDTLVAVPQYFSNDTVYHVSQEDSLIISGEIVPAIFPDTSEKIQSPHRASMYASVIPGLGQFYNKKYWKIPILFGGIGGVAYALSFNSERYGYYRNAYRDFIIRDPANKSYLEIIKGTIITEESIYNENQQWFRDYLNSSKKRFKRYRDISYASVVAVYLISIIDATIDAHFYYFNISDDLSFKIEPAYLYIDGYQTGTIGFNMKFIF